MGDNNVYEIVQDALEWEFVCASEVDGCSYWNDAYGDRAELWIDWHGEPPERFEELCWVTLRDDQGHIAEGWIGYFGVHDEEDDEFELYCNVVGPDPRLLDFEYAGEVQIRTGRAGDRGAPGSSTVDQP
jgi:hypothetical protein